MAGPDAPKQIDPKLFQELHWRSIGPFRGGRVLAVTGVRGQPDTYYFGSVGGGVWKTDDAGRTWKAIFPNVRHVVVPKGNHFPMCDAPDLVAREIHSFAKENQ